MSANDCFMRLDYSSTGGSHAVYPTGAVPFIFGLPPPILLIEERVGCFLLSHFRNLIYNLGLTFCIIVLPLKNDKKICLMMPP